MSLSGDHDTLYQLKSQRMSSTTSGAVVGQDLKVENVCFTKEDIECLLLSRLITPKASSCGGYWLTHPMVTFRL